MYKVIPIILLAACGTAPDTFTETAHFEYEIARNALLMDRVTADAAARQYAIFAEGL